MSNSLDDAVNAKHSELVALKKKLDSLKKAKKLAEENDFRVKALKPDLEHDVYGSEEFFAED